MKAFILALTLVSSLGASAQAVFVQPMLFNFGHMVQVQIHNTSGFDVSCSGQVFMNTNSARMETAYYFDFITKNAISMRNFYLSNFQERVSFAHHSIFCQER
jgi:hypothetical protein